MGRINDRTLYPLETPVQSVDTLLGTEKATGYTKQFEIADVALEIANLIGGGTEGLFLGETPATAYRGDRGKTAYDHSQKSDNPHLTNFSQIIGQGGNTKVSLLENDGNGSSPFITEIVVETLFNTKQGFLGFKTPQEYGAKGDGVVDDTLAVQQCFNENQNILLYGTYLITGIIDINSDQNIYANGCVMVKTSTTEPILRANNKDTWTIDGRLQMLGSGKEEGTASGITVTGGIQCSIRGVTSQNFSGSGFMFMNGTSVHRGDRLMVSDCFAIKNWRGVYIDESMQYISIVNLNARENQLGAEIRGGNITITGGNIVDNDNGTYIGGTIGNNNSHGIFNGVNLNHNDYTGGYNIRLENAELGQTFTGCHIYGETKSIEILNSKAASFVNCIIDGKIDIQDTTDTGNKHYFSHCQLEPLVNVSGTYSDNLVFKTCFNRDGTLSVLNSYDNVITGLNTDHESGYEDLGNFSVLTIDSPAINKGGSLSLGGNFFIDSGSNKQKATFAEIAGRKKNTVNGDISGYIQFRVSNNSVEPYLSEVGRWLDNGHLIIGDIEDSGDMLQVDGEIKASPATKGTSVVILSQLGTYGKLTVNPTSGVITIPHGLEGIVPSYIEVNFSNYGSIELREYSKEVDATNITITFNNTPSETTLDVWWRAIP